MTRMQSAVALQGLLQGRAAGSPQRQPGLQAEQEQGGAPRAQERHTEPGAKQDGFINSEQVTRVLYKIRKHPGTSGEL